MNLECTICTDLFVPSAEVDVTPCGHMFHHLCLSQWFEESNTCPQCRRPCTATQLIKVYFNVTDNLDTTQVNAWLLKKLDNLENKLKTFESNATEHKNAMEKMQETIEHLVVELRTKDNNMLTLRDEMRQSRYMIAEVQEKLENVHLFCKSTTSDDDEICSSTRLRSSRVLQKIFKAYDVAMKTTCSVDDSSRVEHRSVICDVCEQKIVGFRYKCLSCPNYDLCMSCEAKFFHKDHLMIRIDRPVKINGA